MWSLLASAAGWLFGKGGDMIGRITGQIVDLQIQKANAQTEQEKNRIQGEIDALKVQAGVLNAQDSRNQLITNMMRIGFALPFAVYIWKLVVHDKILCPWWNAKLGQEVIDAVCRTDNLSTNLWALCLAIIGYFYMVTLKR
jgi:hypothetical protein